MHEHHDDQLVVTIRWPADADERDRLAAAGTARLLLVAEDAPPPISADPLEDWVRLPAKPEELVGRRYALRRRAERNGGDDSAASLDADGVLRRADQWVAVPPVEAALLGCLLAAPGAVVGREHLLRAGWGDTPPANRSTLDHAVRQLRQRIRPLGLAIHTVTGQGFLLEHQFE